MGTNRQLAVGSWQLAVTFSRIEQMLARKEPCILCIPLLCCKPHTALRYRSQPPYSWAPVGRNSDSVLRRMREKYRAI